MSLLSKATKLYKDAIQLESKDRIEESIGRMHRAIEMWENNDYFHYYLGTLYSKVGAHAAAIASFRIALMHNPKNEAANEDLKEALIKAQTPDISFEEHLSEVDEIRASDTDVNDSVH